MSETVYDLFRARGLSRRDFMRFCTAAAGTLGLSASVVPTIARALESKPRVPVIWRSFQECTCCSESLIRSAHPLIGDVVLDMISLDYHEVLMAAAGHRAEEAMAKTMKDHWGKYVFAVEGSVATADEAYCTIAGKSSVQIAREVAEGAAAVVAYGNCASWGCVQSSKPNPTGAAGVATVLPGKTVIQAPGCPPISEVMTGIVVHLITFGTPPQLDAFGRPMAFYGKRVHDTCVRRASFDAGQFAESFDDEGYRKGWCLYKVGCKGPTTYNSCAITRWNGGTSYPIQAGHPCLGCAEKDFWDQGGLYSKLAALPGSTVGSDPDTVGKVALGVGAAAVATHAAVSAVRKMAGGKDAGSQPASQEKKE